jgi:outer membrane receptor for ferrienterochelin and colicins
MRAAALSALAGLAAAQVTVAQAQRPALRRVAGVVVSETDSAPVAGASVAIIGTALRTTTDASGHFDFPRAPVDMLDLLAARIGYVPELVSLAAGSDDDTTVTVVLPPNPIQISPVVVTASREEHLAEEAPVSVSVATAADIARRATIGVDEAIARVPGVEIQDGQIGIRGSSGYSKGLGSRVLLLVDGVPANEADRGGIDWDLLPVTEVERVEVLKGTASALYGSSALGGVVNVITREIPDTLQLRARFVAGGYADPAYAAWRWRSSPGLFRGADLSLSRRIGPVRLLLSGGTLGNQGYRENNDDRRVHGLAKLVLASSPQLQAELVGAAADRRYGQVLWWCVQGQCDDRGQAYQPFRVDSTALGDRTRSTKYLVQATARQTLTPDLALRGRLSWYRTSFEDTYRTASDQARSDRLGGEFGAEWHAREGRVISVGTEGTYSTVTSDLFGDHSQTELAWYAENESAVGPAGRVTLGVRVDAIAVDAVAWNAVASPRLAATWTWWPVRLRASVGRGFRAPSLAERFTSTATQGIQVVPNPNLQNESSWSGEVGVAAPAARHLLVDAALFWSEYRNLIEPELVTGGTEIQFANVTRARVRGLDLTARAADLVGRHVTATLAWTWLDARDLTANQPLAFRPRNLATLGADWLSDLAGAGTVTLGFDARVASRPARVEIFEGDRRVPARTLDLRATWRRHNITVVAKVENAFNYLYTLVPRTLEPPRTYSLALTLEQ